MVKYFPSERSTEDRGVVTVCPETYCLLGFPEVYWMHPSARDLDPNGLNDRLPLTRSPCTQVSATFPLSTVFPFRVTVLPLFVI